MKEYLKKNGVKLGVVIVAIVLIVLLSARALSGSAGFLTDAVGSLREPVRKAASSVSDWLSGIYAYLYDYDQLKAENDALRTQLEEARAEARAGADASEENVRLRQLLELAEKNTDYVFESAKIVSWNASNWASSFTISKGEKDGIEVGDCVITEYGALVGQVTELGAGWATVNTLIDVDTSVGALVGEDGAAAMLVGDYALMRQGQVKLTWLTEGAQLFLGDTILTSGSGGVIPQGVNIGTISSIQTEAGGQTEYGIVTPAADLTSLVQVFVIKDFDVVE